ncbi:MAG: sensor histidine kinase [Lachnospira sp.]
MGFSELLFSGFADNFQTEPTLRNTSIVLFFVFSKFTYFILLMIISRFSHNASKDDKNAKKAFANIILLIITILTLLEMFGLYHVLCYAILPVLDSIILIICCVCTIIIDILCVYFMDYITAKNSELLQLHLQLQAETERNYANKILEQSYENQQILIHDMKNHLNTISNLLSGSEPDNAVEYINSLITSKELNTRVRYCSDTRLNAILNRYVQMFDKESIQCNIDVCNSDTGFIKSEHLTSLICNILDNSMEACKNITDASVNIKISQVGSGKSTFISVSNSCIEKPVTNKTGEFITTKPDSIHHGYGLKSIKKIVSYYNGNMQAYYDDSTHLFYILITLEDLL